MSAESMYSNVTHSRFQALMEIILAQRFGDLDKDEAACMELLALSEHENYVYGIAFSCAYMGDCLIGKNQTINASSYLLRAKELSEKHRFLDLLPYICTWLGIYYETQNDRQMAMQYYLDALEFAQSSKDYLRQSILLNNIATQFQNCGNYAVAKDYYIQSFTMFNQAESSPIANPHYAQLTANIINTCCMLKELDMADYYLALLKSATLHEENQNQVSLCELLIATCKEDVDNVHYYANKLLTELDQHPNNLHQLFATLLVVAEAMIGLQEISYAKEVLQTLDSLCEEDDYGQQLKVQYIWMQFYREFGTQEEKNQGYEKFYEIRKLCDSILNKNLSDGLLTKIKLRETMHKNKMIEKEKEQLADEAQLDELTQLYNRRSFRMLSEQITNDQQLHTIGYVMIDIDYFKQYNDTYGHAKGDFALRTVADSIKESADEEIYNFRYGGDEFVSICVNKTPLEMESFVSGLRERLRKHNIPHVGSLCSEQVTLSIGYSYHVVKEHKKADMFIMMAEADRALYWAKDNGRNCFYLYIEDMGS